MVFNTKSIHFKLLSSIVLIIFFAFSSLSYYNYISSKRTILYRIVSSELPYYADKAKHTISKLIHKGTKSLDYMINDAYFIDIINNPTDRNQEINNYLQRRKGNDNNMEIGFVAENVLTYYSFGREPGIINEENSKWYFKFKTQKKNRAFNVDMSSRTKLIKLWVQQKVYDLDNNFLGVVYIGFDIDKVKEFVLSQNFGNKGETMMIGLDGGIKIHTDSVRIDYNNLLKDGSTISSILGIKDKAKDILENNDNNFTYKRQNGDTRIILSRYIPELKWIMLIDVSQKEILEPLQKTFVKTLLWSLLFTIAIIIIISFIINRITIIPIKKMSNYIKLFANGDLKAELDINSNDEIGEFAIQLRKMQKRLSDIVTKIKESSIIINQTGTSLNSSAQSVASDSAEQAASIEEVSATIEQVLTKVNQNMLNSKETKKISDKTYIELSNVNKVVDNTSASMIKIADKILIISEIAQKTGILSVNAAIEAAKAGYKGRGFSVIANEIRQLSQLSNNAAIEIEAITKKNVNISKQAINMLNAVMPDIEKTSNLVTLITEASIEQNSNVNEINSSVSQLSEISYKSSANSESLTTSSNILEDQAKGLVDNVAFFK